MQWPAPLALTQRINEGRHRLAIDPLILILFKSGCGGGYRNQNAIEPIQEAGVGLGVARAVEAGVVNQIAEFSQTLGACGGADNLMALTPEMGCNSRSDISTTNDPVIARHAWSNTFYRI
jgi:hypothetical protein